MSQTRVMNLGVIAADVWISVTASPMKTDGNTVSKLEIMESDRPALATALFRVIPLSMYLQGVFRIVAPPLFLLICFGSCLKFVN